eukprot:g678.t1
MKNFSKVCFSTYRRPSVILVDPRIHPVALSILEEVASVTSAPPFASEDEIIEAICSAPGGAESVKGMLVRMPGPQGITAKLMDKAPALSIIARHGAGLDSVDCIAAAERNILVSHTGSSNSNAVAEYTIALIFALSRGVPITSQQMRDVGWAQPLSATTIPSPSLPRELRSLTFGIVGHGEIGSRVAKLAQNFFKEVIVFDPNITNDGSCKVRTTDKLYDLLAQADVVSLHARLNDSTYHMIDKSAIEVMKEGSLLINTSRGALVDEDALANALLRADSEEDGYASVVGAALDAFAVEPLPDNSPLRKVSPQRLVITPHIATATDDALYLMAKSAATSIRDVILNKK